MDKPPTKKKPSAQDTDAQDRAERIEQLASDYLLAFYRERTEENLETWHLLSAIFSSPERRRALAQQERQLAGQAARTNPPHPRKFWRKAWVRLVRPLVADCDGDPEEVARTLIQCLPAELQAKCPGYPADPDVFEAAAAAVALRISDELGLWRACGDVDPVAVGRAVLRGLGLTKDQARSALRGTDLAQQSGPRDPTEKK